MRNETSRLLPLKNVEVRLGLCRRSIEELIERGVLKSVKLGRRRLVDERDLAAFIDSLRSKP